MRFTNVAFAMTVSVLTALAAACGGASTEPAVASAPAATSSSPVAAPSTTAEAIPTVWSATMPKEQQMAFMKKNVAPRMAKVFQSATAGSDRMAQILFNAAVPVAERFTLTQDPTWHDEAILRISALSHNYRGIDGVTAGLILDEKAVKPGERAPDVVLHAAAPRQRLYDTLRHPGFTLLILTQGGEEAPSRVRALASRLRRYGPLVKIVLVSPEAFAGFDHDHVIDDPKGEVATTYGGGAEQMVVVRPDLYVGFRGSLDAGDALVSYLRKWLLD